jgi:CBS domain-containing protein
VTKAGEVGLNITEADLLHEFSVSNVMDTKSPTIPAGTTLNEVITIVSSTDNYFYPVVGFENKLAGTITLDGIRKTFATQELNDWLIALDIAEPVAVKLTADVPLAEGLERMRKANLEYAPVVASAQDDTFVAMLDEQTVQRQLTAEMLARQKAVETV